MQSITRQEYECWLVSLVESYQTLHVSESLWKPRRLAGDGGPGPLAALLFLEFEFSDFSGVIEEADRLEVLWRGPAQTGALHNLSPCHVYSETTMRFHQHPSCRRD